MVLASSPSLSDLNSDLPAKCEGFFLGPQQVGRSLEVTFAFVQIFEEQVDVTGCNWKIIVLVDLHCVVSQLLFPCLPKILPLRLDNGIEADVIPQGVAPAQAPPILVNIHPSPCTVDL